MKEDTKILSEFGGNAITSYNVIKEFGFFEHKELKSSLSLKHQQMDIFRMKLDLGYSQIFLKSSSQIFHTRYFS